MIETGGVKEWSADDWSYENMDKDVTSRRGTPVRDEQMEKAMRQKKEILASKSRVIGDRFKILFWIYIAYSLITVTELMYKVSAQMNYRFEVLTTIVNVMALTALAVGGIYFVVIGSLKGYSSGLFWAGLLFFLCQVVTAIQTFGIVEEMDLLLKLILAILQVIQTRCLVAGAMKSLNEVDNYLIADWSNYWKKYATLLIASVCVSLMTIIPLIGMVAVLLLIVLMIISLILYVRLIILVWKTASSLQLFAMSVNM